MIEETAGGRELFLLDWEKTVTQSKVIKKLDNKNFEVSQNRILSNISETTEEKYNNFVNMCPHIYNRVPLHMLASFLGVSRETLSRMRQQQQKKTG